MMEGEICLNLGHAASVGGQTQTHLFSNPIQSLAFILFASCCTVLLAKGKSHVFYSISLTISISINSHIFCLNFLGFGIKYVLLAKLSKNHTVKT